jgi:beta-phosphoglucomutase
MLMPDGRLIRAVLFDMDGVLVDSMPNHCRAWVEAFRLRGHEIDPVLPRLREGEKAHDTCRWICRHTGIEMSEEENLALVAEKRSIFRGYQQAELFTGVDELLDELRARGFKLGLVTGSTVVNARAIVPADVWADFDVCIAAEDVSRGKPDPQPYQLASERIGCRTDECLVLENAPFGIESARAAGCLVAAITTTLDTELLAGADIIIHKHQDLLNLPNLES